jgi:hypothetical protein
MFRTALLALLVCPALAQAAAPLAGRYVGILHHDRLNRDQLAKLDIVEADGDQPGATEHAAVFTVQFGDFRSGEYGSYDYDDVRQDARGHFFLHARDMDLTMDDGELRDDQLRFRVSSTEAGPIGTLILARNGTAHPSAPLLEPVQGEYYGYCRGKHHYLQIRTYRSNEETMITRIGNPFSNYDVRANYGTYQDLLGQGAVEAHYAYNQLSYEFFQNHLVLHGADTKASLSCQTTAPDGLVCDGCRLTRTSGETRSRLFAPTLTASVLDTPVPFSPGIFSGPAAHPTGNFVGYLHHEYLNQYQPLSLEMRTFVISPTESRIAAVARLFFGELGGPEALAFRFIERKVWPGMKSVMFRRTDQGVDPLLHVTHATEDEIRGVWYSTDYVGRVGTFVVSRRGLPSLPPTASRMLSLAASYDTAGWSMELGVAKGKRAISTDNPFSPLTLVGSIIAKGGVTKRMPIKEGGYDYFTGKIGFPFGDEGRVLSGWRFPDGTLALGRSVEAWKLMQPLLGERFSYRARR